MPVILTPIEGSDNIPAGIHVGTFKGITETQTSKGDAYRWEWVLDSGGTLFGFCDVTPPKKTNKAGRWLSALIGKPLDTGKAINTDDMSVRSIKCRRRAARRYDPPPDVPSR